MLYQPKLFWGNFDRVPGLFFIQRTGELDLLLEPFLHMEEGVEGLKEIRAMVQCRKV
jgi:hypothetical protein